MLGYKLTNPKKLLTDEIKTYLLTNYKTNSNVRMGVELKVSETKIRKWLLELGIKKSWMIQEVAICASTEFFRHDPNLATI